MSRPAVSHFLKRRWKTSKGEPREAWLWVRKVDGVRTVSRCDPDTPPIELLVRNWLSYPREERTEELLLEMISEARP